MELDGKVAFITGGGGGIGGGIAQALAEKGMRLALADIVRERAEAAAAPYGEGAVALTLDVTDLDSWQAAREAVRARFGQVDVLCNNAGVSVVWQPLAEVAPEVFERAMRINVFGVYNGVRTFVPEMVARGRGHVVNTSSLLGLLTANQMATYCATKFAVKGMTDALRTELAPHGVGVSALYPGATRSYMTLDQTDPQKAALMREQSTLMEPIWLGRAVASAIEQNRPHIVTHPASKAGVAAVFEEVMPPSASRRSPATRADCCRRRPRAPHRRRDR